MIRFDFGRQRKVSDRRHRVSLHRHWQRRSNIRRDVSAWHHSCNNRHLRTRLDQLSTNQKLRYRSAGHNNYHHSRGQDHVLFTWTTLDISILTNRWASQAVLRHARWRHRTGVLATSMSGWRRRSRSHCRQIQQPTASDEWAGRLQFAEVTATSVLASFRCTVRQPRVCCSWQWHQDSQVLAHSALGSREDMSSETRRERRRQASRTRILAVSQTRSLLWWFCMTTYVNTILFSHFEGWILNLRF